jgi:hypothetical protein
MFLLLQGRILVILINHVLVAPSSFSSVVLLGRILLLLVYIFYYLKLKKIVEYFHVAFGFLIFCFMFWSLCFSSMAACFSK